MRARKVKVQQLLCYRCGWTWTPRKPTVHVCPKCHSVRWWDKRSDEDVAELRRAMAIQARSEAVSGDMEEVLQAVVTLLERATMDTASPAWQWVRRRSAALIAHIESDASLADDPLPVD